MPHHCKIIPAFVTNAMLVEALSTYPFSMVQIALAIDSIM